MAAKTVGHPMHALSEGFLERLRQLRRRGGFAWLFDLDDYLLEDIGVNRGEV